MPQTALSNGELLRKTLKTVGVMVGSTAVWLGGISLAALLATGSSSASAPSSSPVDKPSAAPSALPRGLAPGIAGGGMKAIRRPGFGGPLAGGGAGGGAGGAAKAPQKPGDPI